MTKSYKLALIIYFLRYYSYMDNQTQLPTSQEPIISTPQPTTRRSPVLFIILGGLILLALGLAGGYFYATSMKTSDTTTPPTVMVPTVIPTPTPQPVSTDKTFTNSTYTFTYPAALTVTENEFVVLNQRGATQKDGTEFYDGISLQFSQPVNMQGLSLKAYVENMIKKTEGEGVFEKGMTPITVNGVSGYTYTVSALGTYTYIFLEVPTRPNYVIYIVHAAPDPSNVGYQKTIDTILSTFSFVSNTVGLGESCSGRSGKICAAGLRCQQPAQSAADAPGTCVKE